MEQKLEVVRKEFKKLIEIGKEIREKEILNYQNKDLPKETDKEKKNLQKVIKRLLKEKRRNYNFRYITKYVGNGERSALRILHIKDQENNTLQILND